MSDKTARLLRINMTDAERKLWSLVRRKQLQGFRFRRQVPLGRYVADFACMSARLVIELDGGQARPQGGSWF
jgi:very-short-patch-repair endonuclease